MFTIIRNMASKWIIASAAAVAFAIPGVSQARDNRNGPPIDNRQFEHREFAPRDFSGHDFDIHDRAGFRFDFGFFPVVIAPECAAPVYETVIQPQWVAPVYQTVCQTVWVPDQYEDRQVTFYARGRQYVRIDHVLVSPGHYETQDTQVCVTPGHWENVQTQVLVGGN